MEVDLEKEKYKREFNKAMMHPLQSPQWANFRKAWGNEVAETPYGHITLHKIPYTGFKLGIFEKGPTPTSKMLKFLKKFGKENNLIFIKLEPNTPVEIFPAGHPGSEGSKILRGVYGEHAESAQNDREKLTNLLLQNGCVKGKTLFTPTTFWIDLTRSEEELLKSFHSKTRYNIRYAEKKGVKVVEDNSNKAFEKYIELMRETVERQGFYAHSEKYHRLMWKYLNQKSKIKNQNLPTNKDAQNIPIAHLLTATYKGEILTTWIVFVYDKFLYYPYGASTDKYKDLQANSLMMWEAIRFGKKMGCTTFDLWGREEGKGFTRFKEGFNPQVVEFLGTWDMVINPNAYKLYRLAEKVRWNVLRARTKFGLVKPHF